MRVAVLDDELNVAEGLADWGTLGVPVTFIHRHPDDEDAVVGALTGYEVVVAMRERTRFPRTVFERLPDLRLLVTTGTKNASIDLEAAHDYGVVVTGTRAPHLSTVELTWALLLGLARSIPGGDRSIRDGGWQEGLAVDLAGSTIGIVGLGSIGTRVSRIAAAFDMSVLAWSPNLTLERARENGAQFVEKRELFARSRFVSLHMVLGASTRHLVGPGELAAMGRESYLVNTARALLVDQIALRSALESGTIAGAGLDVFDVEPLPGDHWVRSSPRTLLAPHAGYVTSSTYGTYYSDAVEDIAAFQRGALLRPLTPARSSQ